MPMTHRTIAILAIAVIIAAAVDFQLARAAQQPPSRPTASVNQQPRVDVLGMPRPSAKMVPNDTCQFAGTFAPIA